MPEFATYGAFITHVDLEIARLNNEERLLMAQVNAIRRDKTAYKRAKITAEAAMSGHGAHPANHGSRSRVYVGPAIAPTIHQKILAWFDDLHPIWQGSIHARDLAQEIDEKLTSVRSVLSKKPEFSPSPDFVGHWVKKSTDNHAIG